jgi:hypothetical protein
MHGVNKEFYWMFNRDYNSFISQKKHSSNNYYIIIHQGFNLMNNLYQENESKQI